MCESALKELSRHLHRMFLANCLGSNYGDKNMEKWSGGDFSSSHSPVAADLLDASYAFSDLQ
jgi:hypothetical protein